MRNGFRKVNTIPQSTFSFEMYMNHPSTTETSGITNRNIYTGHTEIITIKTESMAKISEIMLLQQPEQSAFGY